MKHLAVLTAVFALLLSPSVAEPSVRLTPLKGPLYVVEDTYYARENAMVYVGRDHVTVIGATWTPATAELLIAEIAKVTPLPVTEVINTNEDLDRTGGNAAFRKIGAKIVATQMTRDILANDNGAILKETRGFFPDFPDVPIVVPDTVVPDDFTLQDGAVRGFWLGPSHKPDDIFVWFPNEKVLYGGCILKPQLGNMAGADRAEYPKTLKKLKAMNLPIETVVTGHYSAVHGPELIDHFLQLLEEAKP